MRTRQLIDFENTRRERRWLEKNHPLRQLFWECTLRCNLSCRHCGSDCRKVSATPDMPLEHFLAVLDDVATMTNPKNVLVNTVGGEPLVRPDIVECGKAITNRGFLWGFVTNGVLLTEPMLREVLDAGLRTIAVSLDGLEPEHNWLRGGSFSGAMDAIKLLTRTRNLLWDVITCVNQRNFSTLQLLKQHLIDAGVTKWRIFTIFPQGRAKLNSELYLSPEQYVELMDFIAATRKEGQINLSYSCEGFLGDYEGEVRGHIYRCDAGTMTASILANGDIFEIGRDGAKVTGFTNGDAVLIDGSASGEVDNAVLQERKMLGDDGIISVALAVHARTGALAAPPAVQAMGFLYESEHEKIESAARRFLQEAAERANTGAHKVKEAVESGQMASQLRSFLFSRTRRRPVALISLIEVD